jgi:hemerythrin-like domain-containing protein
VKKTDAIALLKEDHAKVRKLLQQLEKAQGASRRDDLLAKIVQEVEIHTQIEEQVFYPAFKAASRKKDDRKLYFEAQAEHGAVKTLMPELQQTDRGTDEFAGRAKVLKELIEHHAEEEEKEMFPRAKALFSKEELVALGARLEERKESLLGVASR